MVHAIDTIDGWGLNNEVRTAKEEQCNAVFAVHFTVKAI